MIKELEQKYIDVLECLDWKICGYTEDGNGRQIVELEKYSPAGEDFLMDVEVEDFPEAVRKYADDFDQDEHIALFAEASLKHENGVPPIRELVRDAADIEEMIYDLADALNGKTHTVNITVEERYRNVETLELGHEDYMRLKNGDSTILDEYGLYKDISSGTPYAQQYMVFDRDKFETIADWNWR